MRSSTEKVSAPPHCVFEGLPSHCKSNTLSTGHLSRTAGSSHVVRILAAKGFGRRAMGVEMSHKGIIITVRILRQGTHGIA